MKNNKTSKWYNTLLWYASYCKGKMILSIVLSISGVLLSLIPFYAIYKIIEKVIANSITLEFGLKYCIIAAVSYILSSVFKSISTGLSHVSAYTILEKLRLSVIDKFNRAPLGYVSGKSIGEIKNMVVDRIDNLEMPIAHVIPEFSGNFVLPIVVFVILMIIDYRMALASLVTVPLTIIPFSFLTKGFNEKYAKYIKSGNDVSSAIVEYVEGIEVIKAFSKSQSAYKKYSDAIEGFRSFALDWLKSTWLAVKLSFAIFPSTLLGTLPLGILLYIKGAITPSELCLCLMLSMGMMGSLANIEIFMNDLRKMRYTVEETTEFLDMEELPEKQTEVIFNNYNIEFEDVSFSYEQDNEQKAVNNISFSMNQDRFSALIGPSGSGKSTIAKLIARFWDIDSGKITIGGNDIKEIPLKQLSQIVSFVTQDNFLFNCSLMENIRLGNINATDEEVIKASKVAMCHEFIEKLDNGYDTTAGEAGAKLSGGEKQRIAIARMILKDAPIVLLDEASAFTDPENEHKIQQSIKALTKDKTLICIAHRLSTVSHADNIVVLDEGSIENQGKHKELLETCELYKNMWLAHIGAKKRSIVRGEVLTDV